MKEKFALIPLLALYRGENPRIYNAEHIDGLSRDIRDRGLVDRITVWKKPHEDDPKKIYQILKGHCRTFAIERIKDSAPDEYEKLFPDGKIKAVVVEDATDEEALAIKLDHGQQAELTNWFELYLSALMLFLSGLAEKAVVVRLSHLMERVSPLKGKTKEKIDRFREDVEKARTSGNNRLLVRAEDKLDDELFTVRRGLVQTLNRVRRSPKIVEASKRRLYVGDVPEGFEESELMPDLTDREVRKLYEAHKEDIKTDNKDNLDENGVPKFGRDIPGPVFWKLWNEIKADKASKKSSDKPRSKAMSANAMQEEIKDGKYRSAVAVLVTRRHSGEEVDSNSINEADSRAFYMDRIAKHDPDFYKEVEARAKDLISEAATASQAAATEAAATKEGEQ